MKTKANKSAPGAKARRLDLRSDCLSNPGRQDIIVIAAAMLAPDDSDEERRIHLAGLGTLIDSSEDLKLFDWPGVKEAFESGMIVGRLLVHTIANYNVDPEKAGTASLKEDIAKRFAADASAPKRRRQYARKIENTIIPKFRPVAHLWAAYIHFLHIGGGAVFPCRACDMERFLALAEGYRKEGEIAHGPRAKPFLRRGEARSLPPDIVLPRGKLQWRPSPSVHSAKNGSGR